MGPKNANSDRARGRDHPATQALPVTESPPKGDKPGSETDVLRKLYFSILRCRRLEEHSRRWLTANYPATPFDSGPHQHVIAAATTFELSPADTIAAPGSNLAAFIARGMSFREVLENFAGLRGQSSHCCCLGSIGTLARDSSPLACGTAVAVIHKLEKPSSVVLALLDSDTNPVAPVRRALELAHRQRLPIVYVASTEDKNPTSDQPTEHFEPVSFAAKGCEMPGVLVDGEDPVAVWRVCQEAIHRARIGSGPTFIECAFEAPHSNDVLPRLQHHMQKRGAWDEAWRQESDRLIESELPQP